MLYAMRADADGSPPRSLRWAATGLWARAWLRLPCLALMGLAAWQEHSLGRNHNEVAVWLATVGLMQEGDGALLLVFGLKTIDTGSLWWFAAGAVYALVSVGYAVLGHLVRRGNPKAVKISYPVAFYGVTCIWALWIVALLVFNPAVLGVSSPLFLGIAGPWAVASFATNVLVIVALSPRSAKVSGSRTAANPTV